ncbi:AI-2E family transporter [Salegentibacter chungangensis]|uniref:AI-2E family transporter n=1 Tax=Salegentibacter chungangensis TaxID=1335724 RepID=A0ABW3NTU3_9FLAO
MNQIKRLLFPVTAIIIGVYFLFMGLVEAKAFLAPLVMAVILALLMIPVCSKMEQWKMKRIIASLLSTFLVFLLSLVFAGLVGFQVKSFVDDWEKIQNTMKPKIEKAEKYIAENTPLTRQKVESYESGKKLADKTAKKTNTGKQALSLINQVMSFFSNYLLTFIYIFFLLNYRRMFREFILRLFPDDHHSKVENIITKTAKVAQGYLQGRLVLILFLAVLYSIGLGISGVKNFIIISLISAFLSLIPFIGNLVGLLMAMSIGYLTQGDTNILIGIVITFSLVQFIESYILEPYVVGDKVDIHPFFIILAVILGNMVWGIMGMILAIPVLGIINVIFMHIPVLSPFSFLLSKQDQ